MDKLNAVIEVLRGNAVLVSLLVGSVTPLLISVVQQPNLSTSARKTLASAISVVVGLAVAASTGVLEVPDNLGDLTQLVGVVGAVWTAAEAFYQKLWQPAGVGKLEKATSPWVKPEPDPLDIDWDYLENK